LRACAEGGDDDCRRNGRLGTGGTRGTRLLRGRDGGFRADDRLRC